VINLPDGAFSLVKCRNNPRRIGIGIKATDHLGNVRLLWFKPRELIRFFKANESFFLETAWRYAIPPEEYREYGMPVP
jgi:hypothetical protein